MLTVLAASTFGWLVLAVGFLCIWVALAFWPARVADRKGHSFLGYFILSLFFFPLALLMAYMTQDRAHPALG
jgi:1,4-dihydroxy-2-naphthoate octaprenyltransferase